MKRNGMSASNKRPKPKSVLTLVPRLEQDPKDGVFEDVDAFRGTYVLNLYDSFGRRVARWEAADGITDNALIEVFENLVERLRPVQTPAGAGIRQKGHLTLRK